MGPYRPWHPPSLTCCSFSRVKPAGSVNDVGLDALDLDRMKQVRASSSQQAGTISSQWVPCLSATKARSWSVEEKGVPGHPGLPPL